MIITVPQCSSLLPAGTPPSQPALVLSDDATVLVAVIYNSSAANIVIYLSETTNVNNVGTDGNPADGVPLQPGQSLSILPGYRGKIYAASTSANATLRVLYGAKCN